MSTDPRAQIRDFILREFLEGEDPSLLEEDTALVSSGVINSLSLVRLVEFLEHTFHVKLEPHEMNADYLDTIGQMRALVEARRA